MPRSLRRMYTLSPQRCTPCRRHLGRVSAVIFGNVFPSLLNGPPHNIVAHGILAWALHASEAFIGKAPKGEVVVLYFEPLATQHVEASGPPEG